MNDLKVLVREIYKIIDTYYDEREALKIDKLINDYINLLNH